jgi:hypothetical protein
MDAVTTLTIISKPDCHLCDVAREIVDVVVADCDEDAVDGRGAVDPRRPGAVRAWWEKIPVVLIDDRLHAHWRLDAARLRAALDAATQDAATQDAATRPFPKGTRMIRHVVAWKLRRRPVERAAQAAKVSADLGALREVVPSIGDLSIGPDVVGGGNWDVALVADFADRRPRRVSDAPRPPGGGRLHPFGRLRPRRRRLRGLSGAPDLEGCRRARRGRAPARGRSTRARRRRR